jgi:hypothetical protein
MADSLSGPSQNPLATKISQVLSTSLTDYGVKQSLESIDRQFTDVSPASRRQLRTRFEHRAIQDAGDLLHRYEAVISVIPSSTLL